MKKNSTCAKLVKSLATMAFVGGTVAAIVVWARNPRLKTSRLIDKCDDALSELETRSVVPSHAA